jgi:hypothetical protein
MKVGIHMLLWTTHVTRHHAAQLAKIWRDVFSSPEAVIRKGIPVVRTTWEQAAHAEPASR